MLAATLRGGVALVCVFFASSGVADDRARLGALVEVSGEPDQATIRREDYSSQCAHTLGTPSAAAAPAVRFRFSNDIKFGRRELTMFPTAEKASVGSALVYQAPRQEFTLYGERFAESPHVTQHETAIFSGRYVLFAENEKNAELGAVRDFLRTKFPHVREVASGNGYFLVPLSQMGVLSNVLSGKVDESSTNPTVRMTVPPATVKPGMVQTGRGTFYDFDPSGLWVTVYRRGGGAPQRISLVSSEEQLNYASHAAILARMGVVNPERLSPVEQIDAAIAKTPALLDEYGTPGALRGLQTYRVLENRERFSHLAKPAPNEGRWGPSDRASKRRTVLWSALRDELDYEKALPPGLRWYEAHDPVLARAPVDAEGFPSLRVQRPFLVFGLDLAGEEEPAELRIAHDRSSLHLQLVQAHLGGFTWDLDREGHVAGGILEFEYEANPPYALQRIELVDEGMVSRWEGRRRSLSTKTAEWVVQKLLRGAPVAHGKQLTVGRAGRTP